MPFKLYWQNLNSINYKFPLRAKNTKIVRRRAKIKKLANTLIIFNNTSDVMMTSFDI